ncbi:MAG TPA: FHA domain-containing protein [Chitinophagaceae bacterium]|nr:FHA domain-containing protein [Chitinophagaceae bacterium]
MANFVKPPADVKTLRHALVQFIKEQLRKAEGGEGGNIRSLHLFLDPSKEEKHVYEAAVYHTEEDRFKSEVQKIADDFAIELPQDWTMNIMFDELPAEAIKVSGLDAGLLISTTKKPISKKFPGALVTVLNGEAEQEEYNISPGKTKVYIGRDAKVRTADGFYRVNTIAFKADSAHESNKFVSRQHAHIEWNSDAGTFYLFADEGGIPPGNKIKIRQSDGSLVKLQSTQVGHRLQEGDQIILGDSALLQFNFTE